MLEVQIAASQEVPINVNRNLRFSFRAFSVFRGLSLRPTPSKSDLLRPKKCEERLCSFASFRIFGEPSDQIRTKRAPISNFGLRLPRVCPTLETMTPFQDDLTGRLKAIRGDGLYREVRGIESAQGTHVTGEGKRLLNFSSNDYLGLANHPAVKQGARDALDEYGAGTGSARLICGSLKVHQDLEHAIADFKGADAAMSFSSGYATALGTICALLEKDDVIIIDKLVHACIVDGARLSGATLRVFAHDDAGELEDILKWGRAKNARRILVVTESVFSMDGDLATLREIVE